MQKLILCWLDQASALREAFVLRSHRFRGNGRPLGRFTSFQIPKGSCRSFPFALLRVRMTARGEVMEVPESGAWVDRRQFVGYLSVNKIAAYGIAHNQSGFDSHIYI